MFQPSTNSKGSDDVSYRDGATTGVQLQFVVGTLVPSLTTTSLITRMASEGSSLIISPIIMDKENLKILN